MRKTKGALFFETPCTKKIKECMKMNIFYDFKNCRKFFDISIYLENSDIYNSALPLHCLSLESYFLISLSHWLGSTLWAIGWWQKFNQYWRFYKIVDIQMTDSLLTLLGTYSQKVSKRRFLKKSIVTFLNFGNKYGFYSYIIFFEGST